NVSDGDVAAGSTEVVTGNQLHATNERVGAVEGRVDDLDTRIGDVTAVAANAIAYDDAGKSVATLGGANGTVIGNLAAGSIAAGSLQAINGGQLFQSLTEMAGLLGGGAAIGLQGNFVAPNYVIQGQSYNNVGAALAALDGRVSELGNVVGTPSTPGPAGVP